MKLLVMLAFKVIRCFEWTGLPKFQVIQINWPNKGKIKQNLFYYKLQASYSKYITIFVLIIVQFYLIYSFTISLHIYIVHTLVCCMSALVTHTYILFIKSKIYFLTNKHNYDSVTSSIPRSQETIINVNVIYNEIKVQLFENLQNEAGYSFCRFSAKKKFYRILPSKPGHGTVICWWHTTQILTNKLILLKLYKQSKCKLSWCI